MHSSAKVELGLQAWLGFVLAFFLHAAGKFFP
jgi:hypothetical protein